MCTAGKGRAIKIEVEQLPRCQIVNVICHELHNNDDIMGMKSEEAAAEEQRHNPTHRQLTECSHSQHVWNKPIIDRIFYETETQKPSDRKKRQYRKSLQASGDSAISNAMHQLSPVTTYSKYSEERPQTNSANAQRYPR